jgi:hypothetical protein
MDYQTNLPVTASVTGRVAQGSSLGLSLNHHFVLINQLIEIGKPKNGKFSAIIPQ